MSSSVAYLVYVVWNNCGQKLLCIKVFLLNNLKGTGFLKHITSKSH